jgi:dCTP deaminase
MRGNYYFPGDLGVSGKITLQFRTGRLSRVLLSDRDIRAELDAGTLSVKPLEDHQIQPASIDLRLGYGIGTFELGHHVAIDPHRVPENLVRVSTDLSAYVLRPHTFLLAHTLEEVMMPAHLAAQIDGTSTLGRLGLVVHSTAGWVDPGFRGTLTLELSVVGPLPIVLAPADKIAQLCIFRCSSPAERPYGSPELRSRYQGQTGPTSPRRQPLPAEELLMKASLGDFS